MKRRLTIVAAGGLILALGFLAGTILQSAKNGYHYTLLKEKDYESPLGPIKWTCFIESVGFPFLDTEKTMITIGNRTIYKAQRDFQEDDPHARNIAVSSNSVAWEDGDFRYYLTMEPIERVRAVKGIQPIRSQTNSTTSVPGSPR